MKGLVTALVLLCAIAGCTSANSAVKPDATASSTGTNTTPSSSAPTSSTADPPRHPAKPFDRHRHSLTSPRSIWAIVNKTHPIKPLEFHPHIAIVRGYQVAAKAAPSLTHLLRAANRNGIQLKIASAFRSYGYQQSVHANLEATTGLQHADAVSARAGYSEHQTGLAVDLQPLDGTCALHKCFARTPAGEWLAANSWKYGFIVRYTKANSAVTGYSPEPWHFRYVGDALARELRSTHADSLEQFFGVRGGNYRSNTN